MCTAITICSCHSRFMDFLLHSQEIIETTKIDECRDRWIGILIWHFVHHTPVHLFGRGPWFV